MSSTVDYKNCTSLKLRGKNKEERAKLEAALNKIWKTEIGKAFFRAIKQACDKVKGRRIVISYGHTVHGNSCRGNAVQYIKMIHEVESGESKTGPHFTNALQAALHDGHTLNSLATTLYRMKPPSLMEEDCIGESPLTKPVAFDDSFSDVGAYQKEPALPVHDTDSDDDNFAFDDDSSMSSEEDDDYDSDAILKFKAKFEEWKVGNALRKEHSSLYECVILLLEDYWEPGKGSNCLITYDDRKTSVNGKERPMAVALFHELCHAYYAVQGRQLSAESPPSQSNTLYEGMTVGLRPYHHNRPFSENQFRAALGVEAREFYLSAEEQVTEDIQPDDLNELLQPDDLSELLKPDNEKRVDDNNIAALVLDVDSHSQEAKQNSIDLRSRRYLSRGPKKNVHKHKQSIDVDVNNYYRTPHDHNNINEQQIDSSTINDLRKRISCLETRVFNRGPTRGSRPNKIRPAGRKARNNIIPNNDIYWA